MRDLVVKSVGHNVALHNPDPVNRSVELHYMPWWRNQALERVRDLKPSLKPWSPLGVRRDILIQKETRVGAFLAIDEK